MYDAAQAASGGGDAPGSPADGTASTGADDNVIDAEFEKK